MNVLKKLTENTSPIFKVIVILISALLILSLSSCCQKPLVTPVYQAPSIPEELKIKKPQIERFAGGTCKDLASYTKEAIETYSGCAADFNKLSDMVKEPE